MELVEAAKYGGWGVAVISIIAFCYLFAKVLLFLRDKDNGLCKAIEDNTKIATQLHEFLKNLNGRLKKSVKGKTK